MQPKSNEDLVLSVLKGSHNGVPVTSMIKQLKQIEEVRPLKVIKNLYDLGLVRIDLPQNGDPYLLKATPAAFQTG